MVHTADAASRHPMALGVLVLAIGAFLLIVGFLATTGPPFQEKYRLQVTITDEDPVVRAGQAVRVGGRLAGIISDVEPDGDRGRATVTANITKPGFRPMASDTKAYLRVHSIVYETYLELRPGKSEDKLGDGDRLRTQAGSGVDLLETVQLFDRKAQQNLRRTAVATGVGLAGRGRQLNGALADTPPLARDMSAQLGAATRQDGALGRIVAGASRTARGARGARGDDVEGMLTSADSTLGAVARRREDLRLAIRGLPGFENSFLAVAPQAEPLLDDLAALSNDLRPPVRRLDATLPAVNGLMARGRALRVDADLIADAADPVIRLARPAVYELFPVMTTLGPLNADLRTLLERIGPYRTEYRIPGRPGLRKGSGEISEGGRRFIDSTDDPVARGLAPWAPTWRVLPVVSPRPCQNPFPKPGQADKDTAEGSTCLPGGRR